MDLNGKRVLLTGGKGFLGKCVYELLKKTGVAEIFVPSRYKSVRWQPATGEIPVKSTFDLVRSEDANTAMYVGTATQPDIVIHLAAEVGGIGANMASPGRFFYANMMMGVNLIEASRIAGVKKFVQISTTCGYACHTPVPFKEENFLDGGRPERTNEAYAIAKRSLLTMLEAYQQQYSFNSIYLIPVNLYGPRDNFDARTSHVIPALIKKFVEARKARMPYVYCWGDGSPSREFLYVEDCAEAIVAATEHLDRLEPVNIGSGNEITMLQLAAMVKEMTGYEHEIRWDPSKPNGQPRRCLDVSKAERYFGWKSKTGLAEGLKKTIKWYEDLND